MRADALEVEASGANDTGSCECCGHQSRCVWGFVHAAEGTIAAYFVHWICGRVQEHGANFDLIIGEWGEASTARDRALVALEYRVLESGPAFMVRDSSARPVAENELVGQALRRAEVVVRPIAERAFAIADAVLARDERVAELSGAA